VESPPAKTSWSKAPWGAFELVQRAIQLGAEKHGDEYLTLPLPEVEERCLSAAVRHLVRHVYHDEFLDNGGLPLPHLALAGARIILLLERFVRDSSQ
jgi:hypothetical protein